MDWDDWLIIKYLESNKTLARAINLKEVLEIRIDSGLVGAKLKRRVGLVYKNGSEFVIPDNAEIVGNAPAEYEDIIRTISQELKV